MNILLSTTRQWNPGDEWVRMGVERILSKVLGINRKRDANWMIYDRNPDRLFADINRGQLGSLGNSEAAGTSLVPYDLIVVAGTPEWSGAVLQPLTKLAVEQGRRIIYLGIGSDSHAIMWYSPEDNTLLTSAPVITCRDKVMLQLAHTFNPKAIALPCPALYAASPNRTVKSVERIGVVAQAATTDAQRVPKALSADVMALAYKLEHAHNYQVEVIAHYVDDFHLATQMGLSVRYTYDAEKYIDIYAEYDAIISTRLHGAILATSLGIPSFLINSNTRCTETAKIIPSIRVCDVASVPMELDWLDVAGTCQKISEASAQLWAESFAEYVTAIRPGIVAELKREPERGIVS